MIAKNSRLFSRHVQKVLLDLERKFCFVFARYIFGPGLDRGHRLSDGRVLLDVDGSVDGPIPDRRLVAPVDHVDLHLDGSGERRKTAIFGDRFQFVRGPLHLHQVSVFKNYILAVRSITSLKSHKLFGYYFNQLGFNQPFEQLLISRSTTQFFL